jgi:hypothetical protein
MKARVADVGNYRRTEKSVSVIQKKRGRPATGQAEVISLRLPADTLRLVDQWAKANDCGRSEAIRELIKAGAQSLQASRARRLSKLKSAPRSSFDDVFGMSEAPGELTSAATIESPEPKPERLSPTVEIAPKRIGSAGWVSSAADRAEARAAANRNH